jgi:23S rRNA (pseudouridine1915-N3)-methyltransferase
MLKITLITLGNKMPEWVQQAVNEFTKRLQEHATLKIHEIPLIKRNKGCNLTKIMEQETTLIMAAIPVNSRVIALDRTGETFDSEQLSVKIERLQQITHHLCLIIGGPEGLTPPIINLSHERWSLSKLTLPHTLARIVLLETIYRAFSILHNHPYHK